MEVHTDRRCLSLEATTECMQDTAKCRWFYSLTTFFFFLYLVFAFVRNEKKKINLIFRRFSKRVFYIFIIPVTLLKCETTQRCGQTFFVLYSSTSRFCSWKIYTREPARDQSCAQDDCWSCDTSKHQWSCSPLETGNLTAIFSAKSSLIVDLRWWHHCHESDSQTVIAPSLLHRLVVVSVVVAVLYLQILTPNH